MSEAKPSADVIFLAALEKSTAEERAAYLDDVCGEDAGLRHRVERLLEAHPEVGNFMEHPAANLAPTVPLPEITERPGMIIGRYKLLQEIGKGGFGVVFMAEQREPMTRRVALKVIKPGMDTREVIARFEAERQALALMDHTNIARVLDAGSTDSGRPYFVMELVRGIPITDYCEQNNLTVAERLDLFVSVCQAVQHAHQKGIIHRDLKPSNVLVTLHDGKPVVKVIDFGVAKALNQRLTERTLFTKFGAMIGTPAYMSPEQAEMSGLDVDTRADIYALGVLLYELLTGTTPFEKDRLRSAGYDEIRRIIREEDAPRPSTRLSTLAEAANTVAERRHTDVKGLRALLKGDLDWIVMKALEKDRTRRYETASGFAADVERHLADKPVEARPPTKAYQLRKFMRRNRRVVTALTSAVAVLLLGGTLAFVGIRAHRAAALAEIERREAEQEALDRKLDLLVEEALREVSSRAPDYQAAIDKYTEVLKHRPQETALYLYRGGAYLRAGDFSSSLVDLEKALELQPDENPAAHTLIAWAATERGETEKAQHHLALAQEQDPESVEMLVVQALALGADMRAMEFMNKAVLHRPFDPEIHRLRARVAAYLAYEVSCQECRETAEADLEKLLRDQPGDDEAREQLVHLWMYGPYDDADTNIVWIKKARQVLEEWVARSPNDGRAVWRLVSCLRALGVPWREVLKAVPASQLNEPTHPEVAIQLGHVYRHGAGQDEKAAEYYSKALLMKPSCHAFAQRAQLYTKLGRVDLAREDYDRALRLASPMSNLNYNNLYGVCTRLGDFRAVIPISDARIRTAPDDPRPYRRKAEACVRLGRWEDAVRAYSRLMELVPEEFLAWEKRAVLLAYLDNCEAYRDLCCQMMDRFLGDPESNVQGRVIQCCSLMQVPGIDYERLYARAQTLHSLQRAFDYERYRQMAAFRTGRYEEAKGTVPTGSDFLDTTVPPLIQAMVHHRLDHTEAARRYLEQGRTEIQARTEDPSNFHPDWATAQVILREAEAMIEQASEGDTRGACGGPGGVHISKER